MLLIYSGIKSKIHLYISKYVNPLNPKFLRALLKATSDNHYIKYIYFKGAKYKYMYLRERKAKIYSPQLNISQKSWFLY